MKKVERKRTRSQIGKASKRKGSSFELKTSKVLTTWWGEGEFNHTPASGALHWKKDNRVSGDIVPPANSTFPFSVECKNHEGWTLENAITNTSPFPSFWDQCTTDAEKFNKIPMLIVKRNRVKPWIFIPYNGNLFKNVSANYCFIFFLNQDKVMGIQLSSLVKIDKEAILSWYGNSSEKTT